MRTSIEIRNGFLLFLALGVYFLLMSFAGLADNIFLRAFNALIILYFINKTITTEIKKGATVYFVVLFSAIKTGVLGILLSIIGLIVFIQLNGGEIYLKELSHALLFGTGLGVLPYAAALFLEGVASVLIGVLILMQYHSEELFDPKLD